MLKLKTLKFKNIGRFVEEQIVDFSSLSGLIQADGQNNNTKGSSAAGKTTLFLALEYLLGINDTPVTILQSRLTKEALYVEGEFDLDGTPLTIARSKKGLIISTAPETQGSSKLAEEALDKILGMPRDLFRVLTHKRQKEGGFFLNFTPKETHAFLVDAKGLEEHAKRAEEIDKDVKVLEESLKLAEFTVRASEVGLQSTLEALSTIGEPPAPSSVCQGEILILKTHLQEAQDLVKATEQIHLKEKADLAKEKPASAYVSFDYSKIAHIDSQLADLQLRYRAIERAETARQSAVKDKSNALLIKLASTRTAIHNGEQTKKEAQRIVLELKKLKEGQCPTCEQSWVTEIAKVKEKQLLLAFETQKALILAGVTAVEEAKVLQESQAALAAELTPRSDPELMNIALKEQTLKLNLEQERKNESDYNTLENQKIAQSNYAYIEKLNALSSKQSVEMSDVQNALSIEKQELSKALQIYEAASLAAKRYQDTLDSLNSQKAKKEIELYDNKHKEKDLKEKIDIVLEAKALVKSFISCSFDEALESIGDKATTIIRGVPNMSTATIQLEGCRETKEGKVKEEVTAVIHMDGEQAIPIKSLSGGERSAVDLAIDLAVIDFLEDATGKGMDLFILDEPFTGLDPVNIEQILEVLQTSNLNKKLIIVDHNEIIKQFVQNKILVIRDGDTSNVVVE